MRWWKIILWMEMQWFRTWILAWDGGSIICQVCVPGQGQATSLSRSVSSYGNKISVYLTRWWLRKVNEPIHVKRSAPGSAERRSLVLYLLLRWAFRQGTEALSLLLLLYIILLHRTASYAAPKGTFHVQGGGKLLSDSLLFFLSVFLPLIAIPPWDPDFGAVASWIHRTEETSSGFLL